MKYNDARHSRLSSNLSLMDGFPFYLSHLVQFCCS